MCNLTDLNLEYNIFLEENALDSSVIHFTDKQKIN
jgi:hypothetical protein